MTFCIYIKLKLFYSIDNTQKLRLSSETKQFLTTFYQDTETVENSYIG